MRTRSQGQPLIGQQVFGRQLSFQPPEHSLDSESVRAGSPQQAIAVDPPNTVDVDYQAEMADPTAAAFGLKLMSQHYTGAKGYHYIHWKNGVVALLEQFVRGRLEQFTLPAPSWVL